mgnify:CR=1 FL=1|jgi:hypothetical protein
MFERIKAYRNLGKGNKFIKGCIVAAELTGDEEMLKEAYEALYLNEKLKKMMWRSKKMAVNYNLAMIRKGL